MITILVLFIAYSAFCWWVVFWDGAEILEGWKAALVFDWFDFVYTADQLRVSTAISWVVAVVIGLIAYFSD